MYNWYQVSLEDLDENVDENLASLTQKTEDLKINKDNLTLPRTVNVIELNCKVVKKVATLHFYINSPFSGLSPFSSKKFHTPHPPSDSTFGISYPHPSFNMGGGGGGGLQQYLKFVTTTFNWSI